MKQLFLKFTDDLLFNVFATVYLIIIITSIIMLGVESINNPSLIQNASYPI